MRAEQSLSKSHEPHKKHNMSKQTYNGHFTCCLATLRGGFATLSTYASFVCRTGVDFAMDCWMLVVKAFSFASLSSRHLYKLQIKVTHNRNAVKLPHISLQDTILLMYKGLLVKGQDKKTEVASSVKTRDIWYISNSHLNHSHSKFSHHAFLEMWSKEFSYLAC